MFTVACVGLVGFDFPLVYIRADTLNQPIFGCNNLTGGWVLALTHVWDVWEPGHIEKLLGVTALEQMHS